VIPSEDLPFPLLFLLLLSSSRRVVSFFDPPSITISIGAEAKITGLLTSSSIFSNLPQNLENGSSVSGTPPRLRNESSDDDEDMRGDIVELVDCIGGGTVVVGERRAKGGKPMVGDNAAAVSAILNQLLGLSSMINRT
jgi:hypothetical protein